MCVYFPHSNCGKPLVSNVEKGKTLKKRQWIYPVRPLVPPRPARLHEFLQAFLLCHFRRIITAITPQKAGRPGDGGARVNSLAPALLFSPSAASVRVSVATLRHISTAVAAILVYRVIHCKIYGVVLWTVTHYYFFLFVYWYCLWVIWNSAATKVSCSARKWSKEFRYSLRFARQKILQSCLNVRTLVHDRFIDSLWIE